MQVDLTAFQFLAENPLLWATAFASIFGLVVHYLYGGFIEKNYRKITWFRRLLLPHFSFILRKTDANFEKVDLSKLYVETSVSEEEKAFSVDASKIGIEDIDEVFLNKNFRPEVLLSSLASDPDGRKEVGNWVLTAPNKSRSFFPANSRIYEVFQMLTAKWQLHVRVYYNEKEDKYTFYAHYEYNPYCPLYSKKHFNSKGMDKSLGVQMAINKLSGDFSQKTSGKSKKEVRA